MESFKKKALTCAAITGITVGAAFFVHKPSLTLQPLVESKRDIEYTQMAIADDLKQIREYTNDQNAVAAATNFVSKYEKQPKQVKEILSWVAGIASGIAIGERETKIQAVLDTIDCLSDYPPETAEDIAHRLWQIAHYTHSPGRVLVAVEQISEIKNPEEAARIARKIADKEVKEALEEY